MLNTDVIKNSKQMKTLHVNNSTISIIGGTISRIFTVQKSRYKQQILFRGQHFIKMRHINDCI